MKQFNFIAKQVTAPKDMIQDTFAPISGFSDKLLQEYNMNQAAQGNYNPTFGASAETIAAMTNMRRQKEADDRARAAESRSASAGRRASAKESRAQNISEALNSGLVYDKSKAGDISTKFVDSKYETLSNALSSKKINQEAFDLKLKELNKSVVSDYNSNNKVFTDDNMVDTRFNLEQTRQNMYKKLVENRVPPEKARKQVDDNLKAITGVASKDDVEAAIRELNMKYHGSTKSPFSGAKGSKTSNVSQTFQTDLGILDKRIDRLDLPKSEWIWDDFTTTLGINKKIATESKVQEYVTAAQEAGADSYQIAQLINSGLITSDTFTKKDMAMTKEEFTRKALSMNPKSSKIKGANNAEPKYGMSRDEYSSAFEKITKSGRLDNISDDRTKQFISSYLPEFSKVDLSSGGFFKGDNGSYKKKDNEQKEKVDNSTFNEMYDSVVTEEDASEFVKSMNGFKLSSQQKALVNRLSKNSNNELKVPVGETAYNPNNNKIATENTKGRANYDSNKSWVQANGFVDNREGLVNLQNSLIEMNSLDRDKYFNSIPKEYRKEAIRRLNPYRDEPLIYDAADVGSEALGYGKAISKDVLALVGSSGRAAYNNLFIDEDMTENKPLSLIDDYNKTRTESGSVDLWKKLDKKREYVNYLNDIDKKNNIDKKNDINPIKTYPAKVMLSAGNAFGVDIFKLPKVEQNKIVDKYLNLSVDMSVRQKRLDGSVGKQGSINNPISIDREQLLSLSKDTPIKTVMGVDNGTVKIGGKYYKVSGPVDTDFNKFRRDLLHEYSNNKK